MSADIIAILKDAPSIVIVVFLVIYFMNQMDKRAKAQQVADEKRDGQWRDFFTVLNSTNKEDVCKLAETMERMVSALDAHDDQAKQIKAAVDRIDENTRPYPGLKRRSSD
jgi:hypothetical protein